MNRAIITLAAVAVGTIVGWVMVDKEIKRISEDKKETETTTDAE